MRAFPRRPAPAWASYAVVTAALFANTEIAHAADPPTLPVEVPTVPDVSVPELPGAPAITRGENPVPWRITMFEDRPGSDDCDPEEALRGRCFEDVRFVSPPSVNEGPAEVARWRSLASQEALLWEGLAYRWAVPEDTISQTLVAAGFDTLPTPAAAWESAALYRGTVTAPDPAAWLLGPAWTNPDGSGFYKPIRYRVSNGRQVPELVVLSGRFAQRLGAKGRPHDFDLMDADPGDSSPFFEQMHPFANYDQAKMERPLSEFDLPVFNGAINPAELPPELADRFLAVLLPRNDFETLHARARARFDEFVRQLSVQVSQFALEDFTPNHMRVFTALSAMVWPPVSTASVTGGRGLVAAARGETDGAAEIAARVDRSTYVLRAGFRLDLASINPEVAADWIALLYEPGRDGPAMAELQRDLTSRQGPNIRGDAPPLADPLRSTMARWAEQAAGYGVDPVLVLNEGQRFALGWYLDRERGLSQTRAERIMTEILLDQLRRSAASSLDDTPGVRATPADVVAKVSSQWGTQLARHGFAPVLMPMPYGGIDPTAICTTLDGAAAQSEQTFGAVDFDVLVRAKDRAPIGTAEAASGLLTLEATTEVIWGAREQLPFLLLDNPDHTPEGTRLAALPGGMAIYRLRWRIWTGWHLFWTYETLPGGQTRLAARTAAVCADTVLAPPDLVPTLTRAALLVDTYRPTTPVRFEAGRKPNPALVPPAAELVDYVRTLALAPLRRLGDTLGGVLLVAAEVDEGGGTLDLVPPTPYARDTRSAAGERRRTSLWARFFAKDTPGEAPVVYPAFRPAPSVASQSLYPLWNRASVANVTFTGGLAMFPSRRTSLACDDLTGNEGFVGPCEPTTTYAEGGGVDLAALTTLWVLDRPRLGVEAGLEVRVDVSHAGRSWTHPEDDRSFTSMFRPGGGLLVGVRAAPAPSPFRAGPSGRTLWGVDRVDGSSILRRVEGGLRAGYLLAPGYNGAEGTFVGEVWGALSARRARAPIANLTPYNPGALYGLFGRVMYATTLLPDGTPRRYELDDSLTWMVGVRGTWDLQFTLPDPPKVK